MSVLRKLGDQELLRRAYDATFSEKNRACDDESAEKVQLFEDAVAVAKELAEKDYTPRVRNFWMHEELKTFKCTESYHRGISLYAGFSLALDENHRNTFFMQFSRDFAVIASQVKVVVYVINPHAKISLRGDFGLCMRVDDFPGGTNECLFCVTLPKYLMEAALSFKTHHNTARLCVEKSQTRHIAADASKSCAWAKPEPCFPRGESPDIIEIFGEMSSLDFNSLLNELFKDGPNNIHDPYYNR